jgi:hypothetical protein
MAKNRIRGPLVTLAAVAALGGGLWLANVSRETADAPSAKPAAQTTATVAPAPPPPPSTPAPVQFPAKANYVGKIPTATGHITLEISVSGAKAIAYACDGNHVEAWLRGSATDGAVSLASKDGQSRLTGQLKASSIVGTLWIGAKKWEFATPEVAPPAGLYVYEANGARNSWIVDPNGGVTGVQRRADGATAPAAGLSPDGTSVLDGQTVTATKVQGGDDVI